MITTENFVLVEAMNRHSRRVTLWGDTGMHLDFCALAKELLEGLEPTFHSWCYYTDPMASSLFDRLMATGLVTYYAAPKDCFSQIQGFRERAKEGTTFVILEDMS
jgi:hypothetical protein